jgi:2-oxoglutarate dehydrogenase E2 component (dihydrolipoamide succinyltransferase)
MKIEIKVPQLPESVSEATLLDWHKKVGEFVKRDENLIDLETDKVVMELPASENGVLTEIIGKSGDIVKSGQLLAYFDTDVKAQEAAANVQPNAAPAATAPVPTTPPNPQCKSDAGSCKDRSRQRS